MTGPVLVDRRSRPRWRDRRTDNTDYDVFRASANHRRSPGRRSSDLVAAVEEQVLPLRRQREGREAC